MNRSITPWTIVLGAALIALPASGLAQTPPQQPPPQQQTPPQQPPATPPSEPQPTQPPAQPPATPPPATQPPTTQPPTTEPPAAQPQHTEHSAAEHLAKAKTALNEIQTTAVTGGARTKLTELKRHVAALDGSAAAGPDTAKATATKPAAKSWATNVAAIDRILTELTTPVTPAGDPTPTTGTTGATGTTGRATRADAAVTVDEATRAKLLEVRTHITAFASAMSGTTPSAPASTAPATTTPPAEPPVTTQPPATQPPTTQPPTTEPPATTAPDKDAARRHLTEARDVMSQLTQLPEAAQLSGDARTQVSELITNFNELITTQAEWRASYAKVQANLIALIGAERTDEANVPPPATGTPGAVGTSGMTTLDPKVREKLAEFRTKLVAFERAAGVDVK